MANLSVETWLDPADLVGARTGDSRMRSPLMCTGCTAAQDSWVLGNSWALCAHERGFHFLSALTRTALVVGIVCLTIED